MFLWAALLGLGWPVVLLAQDDVAQQLTEQAPVSESLSTASKQPERPAEAAVSPDAAAVTPGSELAGMTGPLIRMVVSLLLVLAVVAAVAWLARRFRGSQLQGGLIEIVSGLSLGPKDRVVLLRVGEEEVLVGLSPAGMRPLHVMGKRSDNGAPAAKFSLDMEPQDKVG